MSNTARTLDPQYFVLLNREVKDGYEYQSYQAIYPNATMVLHSLSDPNSPVAAVTLLPRVRGGNAKTVVTRRAPDALPVGTVAAAGGVDEYAYFHGFTNVDNEEFALAIHNLTDFVSRPDIDTHRGNKNNIGYLKIDILGHKHKVVELDMPTIGINQVNELRPSESYLVQSDQRTGHKTMVLRGEWDEATGKKVTVEKDEADAQGQLNDKTRGTYFFINVVASSAFPAMVSLLQHTTWRAVDVFTRRIPKDNGRRMEYGVGGLVGGRGIADASYGFDGGIGGAGYVGHLQSMGVDTVGADEAVYVRGPAYEGELHEQSLALDEALDLDGDEADIDFADDAADSPPRVTRNAIMALSYNASNNNNRNVRQQNRHDRRGAQAAAITRRSDQERGGTRGDRGSGAMSSRGSDGNDRYRGVGDRDRGMMSAAVATGRRMATTSKSIGRPMQEDVVAVAATPSSGEIKGAQAAKVVQGSQTISVTTSQTGHVYAYNTPGERVCLGLAVWRDMRTMVRLTPVEAEQEAVMQMQDAVANHGQALLDSLTRIYKQDECSICLTNEPNIVFFQCGHSCICKACHDSTNPSTAAKRCYLCRAPVAMCVVTSLLPRA